MRNQNSFKQKSIYTSITGTSTHQLLNRQKSISVGRYAQNIQSQKQLKKSFMGNVRNDTASSRHKIIPRRYATLNAEQQGGKLRNRKSKSSSSQHFLHGYLNKIGSGNQPNAYKNIIKLQSKTQTGLQKLHTSLNCAPTIQRYEKLNKVIHTSQTQNNEDQGMSFLSKLNLQKRKQIMQIYKPKVKDAFKSIKVRQGRPYKFLHNGITLLQSAQNKSGQQKKSQKEFISKHKLQLVAQNQDYRSKWTENIQVKSQNQMDKVAPITHIVLDKDSSKSDKSVIEKDDAISVSKSMSVPMKQYKEINRSSVKKEVIKKRQQDQQLRAKVKMQESSKQQPQFSIPKYSSFYDNYVPQKMLSENKDQVSEWPLGVQKGYMFSQVDSMMSKCYSPIISLIKANVLTPCIIKQPCPNAITAHNQQLQSVLTSKQHLVDKNQLQRLRQSVGRSNNQKRDVLKLKGLNDFLVGSCRIEGQSFKVIKTKEGTCFGQTDQQNQLHGLGVIFYRSGKLFQGQFESGMKSGQGYQLYPDGSFFLGHYLNNKKNGKGRFQWPNGQIYDGQWLNDQKNGSGQWKAQNQISYVGEWSNNKIQGFGVLVQGQERYEGQFINFTKHGHGTYRYGNGQLYTGQFKSNRLNGQGEYLWPNQDHYKGQFMNNKRHGRGILSLASSNILYRGSFKNDKKCGLGEQTYQQRVRYTGNFQNDLKHGWGILEKVYSSDEPSQAIIYQGYWVNNQTIQMNQTPVQQFENIQEDEAEYLKNQQSRYKFKSVRYNLNQCSPKNPQSKRHPLQPRLKPKQNIALKRRSRYMRMNNHYIQKQVQRIDKSSPQKAVQRLQKSSSPSQNQINKVKSKQKTEKQLRKQNYNGQQN